MDATLRLAPVTPANIDAAIAVKVRPDQEGFVSPVVKSLAEAYVHPDVAWPRLILDGDRPAGFLMAFLDIDWDGKGLDFRSGLW
ncbi:MAG: GNAT family N-acetyltransferase, partial [Nonomuraea sp.]|nr:GNAT family N-acetyltransferase [Nonomuraea sp.]